MGNLSFKRWRCGVVALGQISDRSNVTGCITACLSVASTGSEL